jgi:hypothetical protein
MQEKAPLVATMRQPYRCYEYAVSECKGKIGRECTRYASAGRTADARNPIAPMNEKMAE